MSLFTIHEGDCLQALRAMPDASVDAIVTDPPYGLSFMGKKWDYDVPSVEVWAECLRVLKPGGHLLAFAGTRTQHRMAVRIEDAGFEIRDMIAWVYGSGFPKSADVSKAIDKAAGAEREVVGPGRWNHVKGSNEAQSDCLIRPGGKHSETAPATDSARQWQGWGTALKPALEPITVARKPLDGTVAANVLAHGTGALNIDGCRVGTEGGTAKTNLQAGIRNGERAGAIMGKRLSFRCDIAQLDAGRWPANLIHDGSEEVADVFGDPARFFYCAKASKADRDEGLEHMDAVHRPNGNKWTDQDYRVARGERPASAESGPRKNIHPTVKPTALKPALEPITVARKPLASTVAANVLAHGTGALNIDGCRVGEEVTVTVRNGNSGAHGRYGTDDRVFTRENPPGRWPANLIHDGSGEPTDLLGDAARFFYCAKASKKDRNAGTEALPQRVGGMVSNTSGQHITRRDEGYEAKPQGNHHPTVKPTDLMRYLCRLVTPPGGVVLDPFMGSGSTGKAALLEGFRFIGCERSPEYVAIARARIDAALQAIAAEIA